MVRAHKHLPAVGLCRLCRQTKELERSHVHSRLAYKRFASVPPGTPFIDLAEMSRHNRQLQRRWFCRSCESIFERDGETPIANWLDQLGSLDQTEYEYGSFLHSFAGSLVYRYCLLDLEDGNPHVANREMLRPAMQTWRDLILRKRKTAGIYTLHGFLVPADKENGPWEAALGGQIAYVNHLAITRTGPLVIVGLLRKRDFTPFEAKQWSATEISPVSGRLRVVRKSDNYWAITSALADALNHTASWCYDRTLAFRNRSSDKSK